MSEGSRLILLGLGFKGCLGVEEEENAEAHC